jgi:hypothetical protein
LVLALAPGPSLALVIPRVTVLGHLGAPWVGLGSSCGGFDVVSRWSWGVLGRCWSGLEVVLMHLEGSWSGLGGFGAVQM